MVLHAGARSVSNLQPVGTTWHSPKSPKLTSSHHGQAQLQPTADGPSRLLKLRPSLAPAWLQRVAACRAASWVPSPCAALAAWHAALGAHCCPLVAGALAAGPACQPQPELAAAAQHASPACQIPVSAPWAQPCMRGLAPAQGALPHLNVLSKADRVKGAACLFAQPAPVPLGGHVLLQRRWVEHQHARAELAAPGRPGWLGQPAAGRRHWSAGAGMCGAWQHVLECVPCGRLPGTSAGPAAPCRSGVCSLLHGGAVWAALLAARGLLQF